MLKRIKEAPEYHYSDHECRCDFFLQDTGIYIIRVQGYFTVPCAKFICETIPVFQKWLMLQPHFTYLIVDIQTTETWTEARNYLLKKLRWKYSGRSLKSYVVHTSPLAYSIFELLRKINNRTRFEASMNFKEALQDIATHYQSLNQSQGSIQITVPQGIEPEQEFLVSRYETPSKAGQVRFYQTSENIVYLLFAGKISKKLLGHAVSTCRGLIENIRTGHKCYAIVVDFTHNIQIDKNLLFNTYKYGLQKKGDRHLYFIGSAHQSRLAHWLKFLTRFFFKKAKFVKNYSDAEHHFLTTAPQTSQNPLNAGVLSKTDELIRLKALCEQQQNHLRFQTHAHNKELDQIQKIIWKMLIKESHAPISIKISEEESPYTKLLQLLDTFQHDQALLVQKLQQQVDERTRAEQAAASANDIKDKFLASMSHEMRTPLNAILGFTRVLQIKNKENLTTEQQFYLKRVQDNGANLLQLTNDILDLSHLEAGKMPFNLQNVELHKILQEVAQQLDILAYNKGLSIELDLPYCLVYTDKKRLQQIIVNLLNNAIKYTQKGQITIWCESKEGEASAMHIQDTGCGIAKEDQPRIFSAFEQINVHAEGAGLGLAISAALATRLGHQLDFESAPGKGSTFSLYF